MMVESYGIRGGTRRSSWKSIQEMKNNMRKVPIIQEKSHAYHEKEKQEADEILNSVDAVEPNQDSIKNAQKQKTISFREYIYKKICFIFANKF